ncbi:Myosin heavy chain B [Pseudomonas coronafaciens pv. atropurpurea]|nr:Myosin heavy chain B [Pseudomonas coronafaciens pv. atropurpurea]RMV67037.1 Myosin heavy chain B [Pseudomonas coronafaciens pv. atropurpurea]
MSWKTPMKTADLHSLQALRALREQRAATRLAVQRERCRDASSDLDHARETLRLHREKLVQEAEQVYGRFSEGLSVSAWRAVQDRLQQLDEERVALQADADAVALTLKTEEQARAQLKQAHIEQQQKTRAWDSLVEQRVRSDARLAEQRDEADQPSVAIPAGVSGNET